MTEKYNIVVSVKDIKDKKDLINQKYDELYNMIKRCQKMFDETKECYDTQSSKEFRLIASEYLNVVLLYLERNFKEYIDKLDNVINEYTDFYNGVAANIK